MLLSKKYSIYLININIAMAYIIQYLIQLFLHVKKLVYNEKYINYLHH